MGKLHKRYNIHEVDVEELWNSQGGICPVCKKDITKDGLGGDRPCIDHDHLTNQVRGILHSRCNILLGYALDNVEILQGAIEYLRNPPASIYFDEIKF